MRDTRFGDLTIEAVDASETEIELHWLGSSNNRDPGPTLRHYLDIALAEASLRKAKLSLHFEKLKQFNSSTVAALLLFSREAATRQVQVAFFYDATQRWQAHSFQALARIHQGAQHLQVHGLGAGAPAEEIGEP